jgi:hypothetical protein
MTQLRRDLRRRIYSRLIQWNIDSFDLYDMAELSEEEAMEDIYTILLNNILSSSISMGMDADKLCYVLRRAFAERQAQG